MFQLTGNIHHYSSFNRTRFWIFCLCSYQKKQNILKTMSKNTINVIESLFSFLIARNAHHNSQYSLYLSCWRQQRAIIVFLGQRWAKRSISFVFWKAREHQIFRSVNNYQARHLIDRKNRYNAQEINRSQIEHFPHIF